MFVVSRDFSFSYGHRLYRYDGKCSRLHGHNAEVRVEIAVEELDSNGMALDFVRLKEIVGNWIDESLDHRVFLSSEDPLAQVLRDAGEPVVVVPGNPTAELLAKTIHDRVESAGLNVRRVDFWETKNCRASYSRDNFR
ncbi:MAG: 6-carboxytetrahydropterin synthase [Thermoguttaceae bacterium]|nr:6-carboxytetrahydropterin synthase [Thermoguttaceae bacterium]